MYCSESFPDHTMHDFRHTYATRLLSSGMDIKTVASLLGDTVATVERVYIHYTDEIRAKAAEDINRIFSKQKEEYPHGCSS